jgi:hypothetical protein
VRFKLHFLRHANSRREPVTLESPLQVVDSMSGSLGWVPPGASGGPRRSGTFVPGGATAGFAARCRRIPSRFDHRPRDQGSGRARRPAPPPSGNASKGIRPAKKTANPPSRPDRPLVNPRPHQAPSVSEEEAESGDRAEMTFNGQSPRVGRASARAELQLRAAVWPLTRFSS